LPTKYRNYSNQPDSYDNDVNKYLDYNDDMNFTLDNLSNLNGGATVVLQHNFDGVGNIYLPMVQM
jgi:hypothetical protein